MKRLALLNKTVFRLAFLSLAMMVSLSAAAQTQVGIPGTKVKYSFQGKWNFLNSQRVDNNTTVYLYYSTSKIIVSKGDTALPNLRIRVRKHYTGELFDYVYDRYVAEPYQPLKDYTSGLGLPKSGGMGYIGAYTNLSDKKDYQFRMVYFKVNNTVVEFRLETTKATYPQMEKEFEAILGSLVF